MTKGSNELHLRIYDIKSKNGKQPIYNTQLNGFLGDINRVTFTLDGVYLALARSDNTVNVYDSRYLSEVLYTFKHEMGDTPVDDAYGVVEAQWVMSFNSRRLGLLSGGNDGNSL